MSTIKLNLNIESFDCYLYSGHIFILLKDGSIGCLNFNKIYHALYLENPYYVEFFRILFQRNDYYKNLQGKNFFGIKEIRDSFEKLWKKIYDSFDFNYNVENDLEILAKIPESELPVLDIKIYGMKLFVATVKGVYSLDLHSNNKTFIAGSNIKKYFDSKSIYLNAKCGSLAISTNSDGLFYGSINENQVLVVKEREVSKKSIRTSWVANDIINYETNNCFEYLESETTKNLLLNYYDNEKKEKNLITQFGVNKISGEKLVENLNFDNENIKYAFNSSSTAFFITDQGNFYNSRIIVEKNNVESLLEDLGISSYNKINETQARFSSRYYELPKLKNQKMSRPLSSHIVEKGCILEFMDKVVLFKDGASNIIDRDEVISLRTYPSSLRYKNLLTVIKDNKITIHSFYPF